MHRVGDRVYDRDSKEANSHRLRIAVHEDQNPHKWDMVEYISDPVSRDRYSSVCVFSDHRDTMENIAHMVIKMKNHHNDEEQPK